MRQVSGASTNVLTILNIIEALFPNVAVKNIHIILYNVEEPGIIQDPLRERETALRFRAKGTSASKYPLPSVSVSEKVWSSGSMRRAALSL